MAQPRVVRRRRSHRAAVLREPPPARSAADRPPLRSVRGTITDAGPQFLQLRTLNGEIRVPLSPDVTVWHGGRAGFTALRPGRQATVRPTPDGLAAERIWVDITRVTGTILSIGRDNVEVDAGPHRGRLEVVIEQRYLSHVLVRHPNFEPGHLLDVICLRSPDGPRAIRSATSQPGHRPDVPASGAAATAAAVRPAPLPHRVRGTATWYDGPPPKTDATSQQRAGGRHRPGRRRRHDERGLAYPAVDPEGKAGGCAGTSAVCAPLPYLSRYSDLFVRNDCTQRAATLQVIECGCVAAKYCDRCVECGASPRGRIAELTAVSFVDLGGDLAAGCFNATLTVG